MDSATQKSYSLTCKDLAALRIPRGPAIVGHRPEFGKKSTTDTIRPRRDESEITTTGRQYSASLLHQSSSLFKRNNSSLQSGEANNRTNNGTEHVATVTVRSDATPEQIEAFLDAAKSLHLVDGVLSLSIGKIFVNNTFMVDNSHGIASQGGHGMRVLLRDMDTHRGWVECKAQKSFVVEHAVPLMAQGTTVPMVVAFACEWGG